MRKLSPLFFIFIIFLSAQALSQTGSVDSTVNSLRSFDYNNTTKLGDLEKYAKGAASGFVNQQFKSQAQDWIQEAKTRWQKEKGAMFVSSKAKTANEKMMFKQGEIKRGRIEAELPWENSSEYRDYLKAELSNRMKLEFPAKVDSFVRNDLFKGNLGDSETQADVEKMIGNMKERVMGDVDGLINNSIDSWGQTLDQRALSRMPPLNGDFLNPLSNQLVKSLGESTREGMKDFIDGKMFEQFGEGFAGKINDQMQNAADQLEALKGELNLPGDLNMQDPGAMIQAAMGDNVLGGLGVSDYKELLNLDQIKAQFANDAKALDAARVHLPNINIPTPAYAGILLGAAASHFAKAPKCCFWVDVQEIKRGVRLIKSASWQMNSKQNGFLLLGGDLGGRGVLGGNGTELSEAQLKKLNDAIAKVESLTDKTGEKETKEIIDAALKSMADVKKDLDQAVKDLKDKVKESQDQIAQNVGAAPTAPVDDCKDPLKARDPAKCGYQPVASSTPQKTQDEKLKDESPNADASSKLDPVILYSGEFTLEATDIKIKGIGIDFEFSRHYRNQWERLGTLGYNWAHNYDEKVTEDEKNGNVLYQAPSGMVYRYVSTGDAYQTPAGLFGVLKKDASGFILETDNRIHRFNLKGQLTQIADLSGNALNFEYGLAGDKVVLLRVLDTLGRATELRYNDQALLTSLVDPFGREIVYSYDKEKDLIAVRTPLSNEFPQGRTTRYRYTGGKLEPSLNHNLSFIMDPKGQTYLRNEYGEEGLAKDRIVAQVFGDKDAKKMTVAYEGLKVSNAQINDATSKTTVVDRNGNTHVYAHNSRGLRLFYSVNGSTEKYRYNKGDQVISRIHPDGKEENFVFDEQNPNPQLRKNLLEYRVKGADKLESAVRYTYDAHNPRAGPITRTYIGKDSSGNEVTREETTAYTAEGFLKETKRNSVTTLHEYNVKGQLAAISEGDLRRTFYYDKANLIQITDTSGKEIRNLQFTYDNFGNVTSVTDPEGHKTQYWVNAYNLVVQKQDAVGNKTYYRYDENNNLAEVLRAYAGKSTDRLGYELKEKYTYNLLDNLIQKEIQVSRDQWVKETYAYDGNENLTEKTDIGGVKRNFSYNAADQIIKEAVNGELTRELTYGANQFVAQEKDGLGHAKTFERDGLGRVTRAFDATGARTDVNYTAFGEIASIIEYAKPGPLVLREVKYDYDDSGRKIAEHTACRNAVTCPSPSLTQNFTYTGKNLTQIKDDLGELQSLSYNGFGQLAKITDGAGNTIGFGYDKRGLLTQKEITRGGKALIEKTVYDGLGRPKLITSANGANEERVYDSLGNLIALRGTGGQTEYDYDGLGRLLSETALKPDGTALRTRTLNWNAQGQIEKLQDGSNQNRTYTYDARGRKKTETTPEGITKEYGYDILGNLTQLKVGGETITYAYDAANRLTERKSASNYRQAFEYDALGRLIASVDSNDPSTPDDDVTAHYATNALNQVIAETTNNLTTQKTYDARGRKTQITYPSGEKVENQYDPAGWLTEVKANGQNLTTASYALLGYAEKETLGNGIQRTSKYDSSMQLIEEAYQGQKTTLSQIAYRYDGQGRVTLKENKTERKWTTYNYNELDQLTQVGEGSGTANPKGTFDALWSASQTKREYAYGPEGEWKSFPTNDASPLPNDEKKYDSRGNLTAQGDQLFEYDAWNRLIRVKSKSTNQLVASYTYDAQNRRITKTVSQNTTRYAYDGWNLIEEYQNQQPAQQYFHGKTIDEPIAIKTANKFHYLHRDRLGSITALSDETGTINEKYNYTEYGTRSATKVTKGAKTSAATEPAPTNPWGFTGQYLDTESNLYYYKNRYYSPAIGQFITQDPLGMIDGPNVYAYVNNDPINKIDPMGTNWLSSQSSGATTPSGISGDWGMSDNASYGDPWSIGVSNSTLKNDWTPGISPDLSQPALSNEAIAGNSAKECDRQRRRWRERNRDRGNNFSFFDERGKELLGRWLNGTGEALYTEDGVWGEYMSSNALLQEQIDNQLLKDANSRTSSGPVNLTFHAEIENGYFTGYEMLHGTDRTVGNFQMQGYATITFDQSGKKTVTYNLKHTWNDRIDPNHTYKGDTVSSNLLKKIYNPKDYEAHISWHDQRVISTNNNEDAF